MADYSVKQVAKLVGVAAPTLRAWERRYQVVTPTRTGSQYRIYSEADVGRLRQMATLTASGVPASLAALQVKRGEASQLAVSPEALVRAAANLDADQIDALLDAALSQAPLRTALETQVMPALHSVGDAWRAGELSVASEHILSEAVSRRLGAAYEDAHPDLDGPVVAVGLPPGAMHQLGALATATCLRRRRLPVRYLGTGIPLDSWQLVAATAQACVIAVPTDVDARPTAQLLTSLEAVHIPLYIGGPGAHLVDAPSGVVKLTGSVTEGADRVAADLAGSRSAP